MLRVWVRRAHRHGRRTAQGKSTHVTGKLELLCLVAVVGALRGGRIGVAHGLRCIAREGDKRGIKGSSDVLEGYLHRRDVGRVASFGPGEDVAANVAGGSVEYPCTRVARGYCVTRIWLAY